jgi:hypothetical protein
MNFWLELAVDVLDLLKEMRFQKLAIQTEWRAALVEAPRHPFRPCPSGKKRNSP